MWLPAVRPGLIQQRRPPPQGAHAYTPHHHQSSNYLQGCRDFVIITLNLEQAFTDIITKSNIIRTLFATCLQPSSVSGC